ncbi:MAG: hypothetical protein K2N94_06085 [Lachnospiraceae bacterium]|nr:hypothetical protein [Lachnospiraceae bacterium]
MLEELKGKAQKTAKKRMIGWAIAIVVLMFAPLLAPIRFLIGGTNLTGKENLDYSKYEGKYVELDVKYVIDYYMEEYSVDKNTGRRTSTNSYGYIVYNLDDNSVIGVWMPKRNDTSMKSRAKAFMNWYNYGTESNVSVTAKGTLKKLTGSSLDYFQKSLKSLEKDGLEGVTDIAEYYYIDYESVSRIPTTIIYIIYLVCAVGIIVIIVSAIQLATKKSERDLKKFLNTHPGITEAQIDSDMRSAVRIGNSNAIFAGQRFTVWQVNTAIKIMENSKLVWAYYYRVTGRNSVSQTRIYNIDKKLTAINASEDASNKLLNAYLESQPHMVIGYKAELDKQFRKDFQGFLNLTYNRRNDDSAENGFAGTDGYDTQFSVDASSSTEETTNRYND